jgi:4-cresol dehydrogenase (hydroxylating)
MKEEAIAELERIVGPERLCTDPDEVGQKTNNTLGLKRQILGIIYPQTTEQVQAIVEAANRHGFALYPYSTAKNIGYGERLPVTEGNLIVDLGGMNEILHVDTELGYADVQPGVTQGQLCDSLRERGVPFFVDTTGSGRDSGIVGNSLEGGFGTTPRGNKRKEITCVKGVYGNGERFDTGHFPGGLGPDLAGMFVQSNFGIITELRMPLTPAVEDYRSFAVNVPEESDLIPLLNAFRELRQRGTITNQVIIANALDALFASLAEIPEAYADKTLTNADANEILSSPLASYGAIASIGAIYGSKEEVRAKFKTVRRALRRQLGGRVTIRFFSDRKVAWLAKLVSAWPLSKLQPTANLSGLLESFREAHGLMQGIASDVAVIGLLGGVQETYEDTRLMWYSSRISSRAADVAKFVETASGCYARYGFEYPLEMLLVTANDIIAIQKIDWRKGDEEQEARAWELYEVLRRSLQQAGFSPYRLGVQSQEEVLHPEERRRTLQRLKETFDPNNVIAPGRYGIERGTS